MEQNLQKNLEHIISRLDPRENPPSLLLHSCCGPCSSYVLEYLSRFFAITLYYYNPNIFPREEYSLRLSEQKRLLLLMPLPTPVKLIEGEYDHGVFTHATKGLESEPEGGARCEICFRLRLDAAALKAKELGCDYFSTTLSVSPHKNAALLDEIASELSHARGVPHLPADFKKRGGYQRSIAISKECGLYRQEYCGCRPNSNRGFA